MRSNYLFTSESVSEGYPDKVSDQISDAIVDLMLAKDPNRVACETMTTTQRVILSGEIRLPRCMTERGRIGAKTAAGHRARRKRSRRSFAAPCARSVTSRKVSTGRR